MPTNEIEVVQGETDIFARQRSIPLTVPAAVSVVGVGGVGSWIAYFLALAGVPKLYLFDGDKVSNTNLNRTPFLPAHIGMEKTEAMKSLIKLCRPNCEVFCYPKFSFDFANALGLMNPELYQDHGTWIVPSTDTWASRHEVYRWARQGHISCNYIEAAAEGEFGSISAAPAEWATADEENPGYASVPVWVGPSVSAALMACNHILHSTRAPESARLGWTGERIAFQYREGE